MAIWVNLMVILAGIALLVFWWDSLGAREAARQAGQRICQQHAVQFLDDTVSNTRVRLRRDFMGRLRFYREYRFEYSYSGDERSLGQVCLIGRHVLHARLVALQAF